MNPAGIFLVILSAYLVGSLPFGFLVAKAKGKDIRQHGSGNIGATNVFRIIGKPFGIMVFILDFLKGLLPVLFSGGLYSIVAGEYPEGKLVEIIGALAAIAGHNYTCWLRFKGGKGIATSAGALVGLLPVATPIVIIIWVLVLALTRYVSVASISAAVALPVIVILRGVWGGNTDYLLVGFACLVAVMAVWRHRSNIERLKAGTESKIGNKSKKENAR